MNKSLLEKLFDYYKIDYSKYLDLTKKVNLSNFYSGHRFNDIDNATKLVKDVISLNGKIIIYGDYDADGIMGTSILVKMFEYLGVVVDYYIPSRYLDGYGLNEKHAQEYIDANYDLVITVDNGITAFKPIEMLHNAGIKVLILDHHQAGEQLPKADAICHPIVSHFGEISSSGAFTAFIYSISLLNRVDRYLALLASISLISDMMPLLEYNRDLLRAEFLDYQPGEFLAISLLADNEKLDETLIGMKIAPRINSIGRLIEDDSINEIIKYFTTDDRDFILNYYNHIIETNEQRKNLSKIDLNEIQIDEEAHSIIIKGEYKEGIIGLIANSLMVKYQKPTIVFTKSLDGSLKGSARAPEGYNIVLAFQQLNEYLLTSGGHSSAAGCSIKEEDFEIFKDKFDDVISKEIIEKEHHPYIDILMNELSLENVELINSFSPFGESWPLPLFRLRHIKVSSLMYSRDHKHIITPLGNRQKLVYFNYPQEEIDNEIYIDIVGSLSKKEFKGVSYVEFSGKEIIHGEY